MEFSVCNVLTLFSVPGETLIVTTVATQRSKIKLSSLKKVQRGQDVGEVEIMQQSFLFQRYIKLITTILIIEMF